MSHSFKKGDIVKYEKKNKRGGEILFIACGDCYACKEKKPDNCIILTNRNKIYVRWPGNIKRFIYPASDLSFDNESVETQIFEITPAIECEMETDLFIKSIKNTKTPRQMNITLNKKLNNITEIINNDIPMIDMVIDNDEEEEQEEEKQEDKALISNIGTIEEDDDIDFSLASRYFMGLMVDDDDDNEHMQKEQKEKVLLPITNRHGFPTHHATETESQYAIVGPLRPVDKKRIPDFHEYSAAPPRLQTPV